MKRLSKLIKKKLKRSRGFSLVELLFSIIILMLSTSIIIRCFTLGTSTVIKETQSSEAQILCSALTSSIQNELAYARDIDASGETVVYYSVARNLGANCYFDDDDGKVVIKAGSGSSTTTYPLVSDASYSKANRRGAAGSGNFMYAYLSPITYDSATSTLVVKLYIVSEDPGESEPLKDTALAYSEFKVKPINGVKTTG